MRYKVGLRTLPYLDQQRTNWAGTAPRPLQTELWYPAVDTADETDILLGSPGVALFNAGRAARDAELWPATFPLLLLSHGTGGAALQLGWLATFLAAQGYLVASVNHHGNNALEPYTAQGFLLAWERAQDVTAVLTQLLDDEWIGPHIQRQQIGAAGFSLGGYTVIALAGGVLDLQLLRAVYADPNRDMLRDLPPEFPDPAALLALFQEVLANDTTHKRSYRDERIRAVFAIAPVLGEAFTPAGLAAIDVPVKMVVGEADTMAPAATNAMRFASLIPQAELTILGHQVAHYTFLNEGTALGKQLLPELCVDAPAVDRAAIHRQVSQWAKEFFDQHLALETCDDELTRFAAEGATPLPTTDTQGYVEHEGARIWYAAYGAGAPVILLHGGLGHSGNWGYQVPALVANGYRAVVIDSRGHGRSTRDDRPFTYELMASDVVAVMDTLQIAKAGLVGWSDGAVIAMLLADKMPDRVAGVFFFACNMDPSGAKADIDFTPTLQRCFNRHRQDYQQLSATPEQFDAFVDAVGLMQRTQPNYTAADLVRIRVPVAIVQSEDDEFIKHDHAEYLAQSIPRAELILLPEVTHFAPLQRPEQFNRTILAFLAKVLAPSK